MCCVTSVTALMPYVHTHGKIYGDRLGLDYPPCMYCSRIHNFQNKDAFAVLPDTKRSMSTCIQRGTTPPHLTVTAGVFSAAASF